MKCLNLRPIPLVNGYQFSFKNLRITLIRCPDHQGCRFHSRGLHNVQAYNEGFIRVESISKTAISSIVNKEAKVYYEELIDSVFYILRGSAPIFFEQRVTAKAKPAVKINKMLIDPKLHLQHLYQLIQ